MRVTLDSSLLAAASHSTDGTLLLEFKSGSAYRYFAVPVSAFEALLAAESKGAFFNKRIRPTYPAQRVA